MFILTSFFFSFIAIFLAFKVHDKYDPARYFSIFWGSQIIIIYALFHNNFLFTGYGLVFISMACLIFSAGTLVGRLIGTQIPERNTSYIFNTNRALLILLILLFLSIINVLKGIYAVGFNIRQIITFNALLELNNTAAINRYSGNQTPDFISRITLIFVYITPLIGGYLLPLLTNNKKKWSYISIIPSLLIAITQAVKLGFITSVALWSIGVLVSSYANNQSFLKIKKKTALKLLLFFGLFISVLFLSMILRTGKFDINTIQAISKKFINYSFGHLPAFDSWYFKNIGKIELSGGIKTFYGISNLIGIAERKQGIFSEFTMYGKNNFTGISTNVYTVFRFIVEDFGTIGGWAMIFISGIVSGFSWLNVKKQYFKIFSQVILMSVLFFISWSFVASVWAYTSYIATMILMYLILIFSFSKVKTETV